MAAASIDYILEGTDFKNLGEKKTGKVRDVYLQEDKVILISTDRHSSFDRIIAHVPHKGEVLNRISAFWFDQTKDIIPNHLLAIPDPNVALVERCKPLPVEVVVRGYITGVTDTSLWVLYQKGQRDFGNFTLPDNMTKNQKLERPVLTPTTKSDTHDRPITPKEIRDEGLVEENIWNTIAAKAVALFERGQEIAAKNGLILVDTKYEFGIDTKGNVLLIDEVHTPDSSRYWQKDTYEQRIGVGEEPEFFDKEFLRLWFIEHCNPYTDALLPPAPPELIAELSRRYVQIFEQITGTSFGADSKERKVIARIEDNLKKYYVSS